MEKKQIKKIATYSLAIISISMVVVFGFVTTLTSSATPRNDLTLEKLTVQSLEIISGLKTAKENAELWNNKVVELQKRKEENRKEIDIQINSGLINALPVNNPIQAPVFLSAENSK